MFTAVKTIKVTELPCDFWCGPSFFHYIEEINFIIERGEIHWKVCDDFLVPGTHIKDG